MIFYHRTKQEYATKILSTENGLGIQPSYYNLQAYLNSLFNDSFLQIPNDFFEKGMDLNKQYIILDESGQERVMTAMYLGSGLYCFSESNKETAENYNNRELDTLLKIKVDNQKCNPKYIFDMTSGTNMKKIRKFLTQDFPKSYKKMDLRKKRYYEKLQQVLLASLNVQFKGAPYCAGIILELFFKYESFFENYNVSEYKIVKSSFIFGGTKWYVEEYVSIRDTSIIECVELA